MNVHLQNYAKNVGRIQDDFKRVVEKINNCDDRVDVHQQKLSDQEMFNRAILERMQELEDTIKGQTERIVSLEEEVATLRWRKECRCSETVIAMGSGEGEESELEYVEEVVSSSSSYHSPTVAQEEVPLLFFGKVLPRDSQSLPIEVQEMCGCPVPAVIRVEDDVEMVVAPTENHTPIPVPPRYTVRSQRGSRGVTKAYFHSSTCHCNRHAMQLGVCPTTKLEFFMGQDIRFPSTGELHAAVL